MSDAAADFDDERPRLVRLAATVLGDHAEAEDVVQSAWLRLDRATAQGTVIDNLPGWLTTVTTRLCLDRLRVRVPEPVDELDLVERAERAEQVGGLEPEDAGDPLDDVVLAEAVGSALQVVLDRLSPRERVAFVLHDSFAVDFDTIAVVLDATPAGARKLASRARAKLAAAGVASGEGAATEAPPADWQVVDAFLAAARGGDLPRLLTLLAPDVLVTADAAAAALGTPTRIEGREAVAGFFDGAARAAFPVLVGDRPGLAWIQHGEPRVVFDLEVVDARIAAIVFRADADVLAATLRR